MSDGETPEEAIISARDALKSCLESMKEFGDPWSKPNEARGEWRQRVPKTLPRRLAIHPSRGGRRFANTLVAPLAEGLGKRQSKR